MITETSKNPLGQKPTGTLLRQFAIPSIIAMLVSSLYNIVDQFFIGQSVGPLGNAATNIAFPLTISCIAIALLFGIGGASAFNIAMGQGEPVGTMLSSLLFGLAQALRTKVSALQGVSSYLVSVIPYVATVLGLVIYAIATMRRVKKTRRARSVPAAAEEKK